MPTESTWDMFGGPDSDGDGLTDAFETKVLGTDPHKRDTDGDGLNDLREKDFGSDPRRRDTDRDGLDDRREVILGTNPADGDTDHDGIGDRTEASRHTIRLRDLDRDRDGTPDWVQHARTDDSDNDILKDGEEAWLRTNPNNADTDGDGLSDFDEAMGLTGDNNPRVPAKRAPLPPSGRQGLLDPNGATGPGTVPGASQPLVDPLAAARSTALAGADVGDDPVDPGSTAGGDLVATADEGDAVPVDDGYTDLGTDPVDPGSAAGGDLVATADEGDAVPVDTDYSDAGFVDDPTAPDASVPDVVEPDATYVAEIDDPGGQYGPGYTDGGGDAYAGEDGYGDLEAGYSDAGVDETFA